MNAADSIDRMIAETGDWRGETVAAIRKTILGVDPDIVEEWKWMGSPVWSLDGLIAVGNAHKKKVKLTFAYGARLADPQKLFNGNDTGQTRRSIDYFEGSPVNQKALADLVRAAITHNRANLKKNAAAKAKKDRAKDTSA